MPPLDYVPGVPPPFGALHEAAAPWQPNEPETSPVRHAAAAPAARSNPEPHPSPTEP